MKSIQPGYHLGNTIVHLLVANLGYSYDSDLLEGMEIDMKDTTFLSLRNLFLRKLLMLVARLRDEVSVF